MPPIKVPGPADRRRRCRGGAAVPRGGVELRHRRHDAAIGGGGHRRMVDIRWPWPVTSPPSPPAESRRRRVIRRVRLARPSYEGALGLEEQAALARKRRAPRASSWGGLRLCAASRHRSARLTIASSHLSGPLFCGHQRAPAVWFTHPRSPVPNSHCPRCSTPCRRAAARAKLPHLTVPSPPTGCGPLLLTLTAAARCSSWTSVPSSTRVATASS